MLTARPTRYPQPPTPNPLPPTHSPYTPYLQPRPPLPQGFIRAETIGFDDFIKHKGYSGAKEAGALRLEGKEYVVKEGDVLLFRFNV